MHHLFCVRHDFILGVIFLLHRTLSPLYPCFHPPLMSLKTHMTHNTQKRTWVTKEEHLRRKRQLALETTFVEAVEDAPDWTFRPLPIKELIVRYQQFYKSGCIKAIRWEYIGDT